MKRPDTVLEIQTLGRFSISIDGKTVATEWPDETLKVLFCSLLSPLDLYFTWDRICRSMWGVPGKQISRHRLEDIFIRPLTGFLISELGFNPVITGDDGIRMGRQRLHVDAFAFHSAATGGLRELSIGNHAGAFEKFGRAKASYVGSYLPGIPGKIITSTRNDLESLYLTAILDAMPLTRNSGFSGYNRMADPGLVLMPSRRPFQTPNYGPEALCIDRNAFSAAGIST